MKDFDQTRPVHYEGGQGQLTHPLYKMRKRSKKVVYTSEIQEVKKEKKVYTSLPPVGKKDWGYPTDAKWVDIISRMYPRVDDLERMANDTLHTRPIYMCEYAHSMGNSTGSLDEYWDLIRSHESLLGGHIWDWMDQGLARTDSEGRKNWGYGGDYERPTDPKARSFSFKTFNGLAQIIIKSADGDFTYNVIRK